MGLPSQWSMLPFIHHSGGGQMIGVKSGNCDRFHNDAVQHDRNQCHYKDGSSSVVMQSVTKILILSNKVSFNTTIEGLLLLHILY